MSLRSYDDLDEPILDDEDLKTLERIERREAERAEHERLQRAVVEAAQAEREAENEWARGSRTDKEVAVEWAMRIDQRRAAVDALNEFETQHNLNSEV